MKRLFCTTAAIGIAAFGWCGRLPAHESPVDPVSRTLTFWTEGMILRIRYEQRISERTALLELHAMDRNRDGIIQESEKEAFMADKARRLAEGLKLQADTVSLTLTPVGSVVLRRGWRQVYEYKTDLSMVSSHRVTLHDTDSRLRPGPFRWTIGRPADVAAKGASAGSTVTLRAGSSGESLSMWGGEDRVELEFSP